MVDYFQIRFWILFTILCVSGFLRGIPIAGDITSTYIIVALAVLGISILFISIATNPKIVFPRHLLQWLALLGVLLTSFMYNILSRPYPVLTTRFTAEMLLNVSIFVLFVSLLNKRILLHIYRKYLIASGIAGGVLVLYPLYIGDSFVRRVGGYDLPGAVNNISMMIGVGVVIALAGVVKKKSVSESKTEYVALPPLVAGLVLSGSRAAIIGVVVSLVLLLLLSEIDYGQVFVLFSSVGVILFIILELLYTWTGLYRFTVQGISADVADRFDIYLQALVEGGTSFIDLLFGGGMYRYDEFVTPGIAIDLITYPHNFIISLVVHIGLPAGVVFTVILFRNYRQVLSLALKSSGQINYLSTATLLSLVVVTMYSFTSGRVTRVFPLWIVLGIAEFVVIAFTLDLDDGEALVGSSTDTCERTTVRATNESDSADVGCD